MFQKVPTPTNGRAHLRSQLKPELASPLHFMYGEIRCDICGHREAFPPGSGQAALRHIVEHVNKHLEDANCQAAAVAQESQE